MKVIFLDIDGVLNYPEWYNSDRNPGNLYGQIGDIDPVCTERVFRVCRETGAKIVISSDRKISWPGCKLYLEEAGFPGGLIIDKTPDNIWKTHLELRNYMLDEDDCSYEFSRGHEIDSWLESHPECSNFVILDDRTDFTEDQEPHFVHINGDCGITDDNVDIAIMILKHHGE